VHIFYCIGGKFGEVAEKHKPDTSHGGTGRCVCASGVLSVPSLAMVRHRKPGTGRGLDPVCASGVA